MSRGASGCWPVIVVSGLQREARVAAGPVVRALVGGADGLAAALEQAVARGARGVISFGISGGLDPALAPGARLVARAVVTGEGRWTADPAWVERLAGALTGATIVDLAGVDEPVADPTAKLALRTTTRAAAADMESHVAARVAAAHRLPFAALRVVCDPACRTLPPAALVGLRRNGTIDPGAVLRSVIVAPRQVPGLLRTALDARTAFGALLRCRRLLGPCLGLPDPGQRLLDMP